MHIWPICGLIYAYLAHVRANIYTCQPIRCQDRVLKASEQAESNYLVARGDVRIFGEYSGSKRVLNYHNSTPIRSNCPRGQTNITTSIFAPVQPVAHASLYSVKQGLKQTLRKLKESKTWKCLTQKRNYNNS